VPHAVPDILTVAELAEYLKVPKSTIYKMAQDHQILPRRLVGIGVSIGLR
jgi:excisionase family DNA binding protein